MGAPGAWQRTTLVLVAICAAFHFCSVDAQGGGAFHRRRRLVVPGFTVRIGGTLGLTGKYRAISQQAYQGLKLFEEVANNYTMFTTSTGNPILVEFDIRDDSSSATEVERLYTEMANSGMYHALIGPYSSGLSLVAARVANQSGQLIMMHQAGSPSVYSQGFQRVFSVNVMAPDYTADTLRLLYERGARTVALAQGSSLFHHAICDGARYHATQLGYQVVSEVSIADADITSGIKSCALSSPDVFVGCGHLHNAVQVTVTSRALMFNPKAMIIIQAATEQYVSTVKASNANYIIGPVTWDKTLPQGCSIFGSAMGFHEQYVARWNMDPSYNAAQAAAAGIALMSSFEFLEFEGDPDMLSVVLEEVVFHTMLGDLNFSSTTGTRFGGMGLTKQFGALSGNASEMQRYRSLDTHLVQDASGLVYPMPSWEQKELEIYPCPLGYVLSETAQGSTCEVCPVGYYRNKASLICRQCPAGRYGLTAGLDNCMQCTPGMDCEGVRHTGRRQSVPGYYAMPTAGHFIQCTPPEACLAANECSSTQKGFLCSQCAEGYTNLGPWSLGTGMCHQCPDPLWEVVGFVSLFIVSQIIFTFFLYSHANSSSSLTALHTVILRIIVNYFTFVATFVAAVSELQLKQWPGFRVLLALFVDPLRNFVSLDCLLQINGQKPFQVIIVVGILLVPTLLVNSFLVSLIRDLLPLLYRHAVEQSSRVLDPEDEDMEDAERYTTMQSGRNKANGHATAASGESGLGGRRASTPSADGTTSANGDEDQAKTPDDTDDAMAIARMFTEDAGGMVGKVRLHSSDLPEQAPSRLQRLDHLLEHVKKRFVRRAIIWIFLAYPIVVHMLLTGAVCEKKDTLRLESSLDVVCQSAEHIQWFRLCVFGLMMYGVGLPSLLFFQLFRIRHQLLDLSVRQNYGFLYNGFEPRYYYFEVVFMVRKLAILSTMAVPYHDMRLLILLGIGLFFVGVHIRFEPYDDRDFFVLDRLESLSLVSFLFSCMAGLWFNFAKSMDAEASAFNRLMTSQALDISIITLVSITHVAFLVLAVWSLVRNVLIKHLRFLEECFPEHLSTMQRCFLRLMETKWHHVRMDPDTHELNISQLSGDERRFLYSALCDTASAYIASAVTPGTAPVVEPSKDKEAQDGQTAPGQPSTHKFYIGFMIAALRRAYKRVEYSRYQRAVAYLQALEEEEMARFKEGWCRRRMRCLRRHAMGMATAGRMEAASTDSFRRESAQSARSSHSERVREETMNSTKSGAFGQAMAWLQKSRMVKEPSRESNRGSAEQRAAASIRKLGVTVEELHLALMLSWNDIAIGKEEYFVLETDEDRERAFRREVLRAEGTTWREDESVKKLFKSLELRRHLKPCAVDGVEREVSIQEADEGPDVEELLGLQPAAEEQASRKALRQEHEDLLVEVLELRSKVRGLERRLQATGEQPEEQEAVSLKLSPPELSPELPVATPLGLPPLGALGEETVGAEPSLPEPRPRDSSLAAEVARAASVQGLTVSLGSQGEPAEPPPAVPPSEAPPPDELPTNAEAPSAEEPLRRNSAPPGDAEVLVARPKAAAEVEQPARRPEDNAPPQFPRQSQHSAGHSDNEPVVQI